MRLLSTYLTSFNVSIVFNTKSFSHFSLYACIEIIPFNVFSRTHTLPWHQFQLLLTTKRKQYHLGHQFCFFAFFDENNLKTFFEKCKTWTSPFQQVFCLKKNYFALVPFFLYFFFKIFMCKEKSLMSSFSRIRLINIIHAQLFLNHYFYDRTRCRRVAHFIKRFEK